MAKSLKVRNSDNTEWVPIASVVPQVPDISTFATIEYVDNEIANIDLSSASAAAVTYLVDSAPTTLDTLNELAQALNDDENFAGTVTTSLSNKLDILSASSTYLTQTNASYTYLTKVDATSIYAPNFSPSLTGTTSVQEILEYVSISASAPAGIENFNVLSDHAVKMFTANSTNGISLNVRGNSGAPLNQIMLTGQSLTIAVLVKNGVTGNYINEFSIDNSFTNRTLLWQGGTAPNSGNSNSTDVYTFTIIKTANNVFTVLASQTKFA